MFVLLLHVNLMPFVNAFDFWFISLIVRKSNSVSLIIFDEFNISSHVSRDIPNSIVKFNMKLRSARTELLNICSYCLEMCELAVPQSCSVKSESRAVYFQKLIPESVCDIKFSSSQTALCGGFTLRLRTVSIPHRVIDVWQSLGALTHFIWTTILVVVTLFIRNTILVVVCTWHGFPALWRFGIPLAG